MNKKLIMTVLLCLTLMLSTVLVACGSNYTVTFETNGGNAMEPAQFKGGASMAAPQAPVKEFFTFDGWFFDEDLQTPFTSFDKMPKNDLTLYAKWLPTSSGKINFNSNGGSAVASISGISGSAVQDIPENPTKQAYTFEAWYSDEQLTSLYVFGTYPVGEITLHAKWGKDTVNYNYVEFNVGGVVTEVAVAKGESLVIPSFGENVECLWYSDAAYQTAYDFPQTITSNIKVYGIVASKGLNIENGVVVSYDGAAEQVIIPDLYNGSAVTEIADSAFGGNKTLSSVSLPQSVTKIGSHAFYKCDHLSAINITAQVKSVGEFAFSDCARLQVDVDLSGLATVSSNSFANCTLLTGVTFGGSLTEVGDYAFANCSSLVEANLPDSVKYVFSFAFANTGIASFNIPQSLVTLGTGALKSCVNLTEITGGNGTFVADNDDGTLIAGSTLVLYYETEVNKTDVQYTLPRNITNIASFAFIGNGNIRTLNLAQQGNPNGVTLSLGALQGMTALKNLIVRNLDNEHAYLAYWFGAEDMYQNTSVGLYVPETLSEVTFTAYSQTSVPQYAFYGCRGITAVHGMDDITAIGDYAFAYTAYESFNVSSKVMSLNSTVFRGANSLTSITVDEDNTAYSSINDSLYNKDGSTLIYAPAGRIVTFEGTKVEKIAAGALYQNITQTLAVPESVNTIELGAFEGMNQLTKLTLPFIGGSRTANRYILWLFGATIKGNDDGSINIGGDNCPISLAEIELSTPVTAIPNYAFTFCRGLSKLVNDAEVTSIGDFAFYRNSLEEVILADSVKTVGNYAYYNNEKLTRVEIGAGATSIGKLAFAQEPVLEEIIFHEGTDDLTIGDGAFLAVTSSSGNSVNTTSALTKIQFSNNIVSIGKTAFSYQGSTSAIDFEGFEVVFDVEHSRLKNIGDSAFGVAKVSKVVLPASIESIGSIAFGACEMLTEVTIGSAEHEATKLNFFGDGAFGQCEKLAKFTLYKTLRDNDKAPTLGDGKSNYVPGLAVFYENSTQIYVPAASVEIYKTQWSSVADYIVAIKED